ncbi:MAG: anti-sigma factor [Actinomycetota bacterium]|nr:anti-sigma factor [Actinomycetota bacterium]
MTTCDEVRERLPEHVLGTLDDAQDLPVRQHLRGCAGCRQEMAALGEGIALFARASHDRTPPPELHDRVRTALDQEWSDTPAIAGQHRSRAWLAAAAAILVVVASLGFGLSQQHRANLAAADALSYRNLIHILGGKEFRVGQLHAATGQTVVEGSVVVYDSSEDQSWVAVFVRAPGVTGDAAAVLHAPDGRSISLRPITIASDGAGSTWLATATKLESFDHLTVSAPDGTPLADATIASA